jgi:hypothetical protein
MNERIHSEQEGGMPESIGMVLWVECYAPGLRSVGKINERLEKSYQRPLNMTREAIQHELTLRAHTFGLPFNPDDIVADPVKDTEAI